jgi:hypothetical protein
VSDERQAPTKKDWGYMAGDEFRPLPITPGLAFMGPPPFDVVLPSGETRRVVERPPAPTGER